MFNHLTSYMKSQFFCLLWKHILLTKFVLIVTKKTHREGTLQNNIEQFKQTCEQQRRADLF